MESTKYTDFGLEVKIELLRRGMKQDALIEEIKKRGLFCDSSYLSKIFRGERNAPKIVDAIRNILDFPEDGKEICHARSSTEGLEVHNE